MLKDLVFFAVIGVLFTITVQDFRFRAVSWILFLLAALSLLIHSYQNFGSFDGFAILWNAGFITLNLAGLLVFCLVKKISPGQFLAKYMGLGDLLFFLVLTVSLPFPAFPVFYTLSLLMSLVAGVLFFRRGTVPLAGIQSLQLGLLLTVYYFHPSNITLF